MSRSASLKSIDEFPKRILIFITIVCILLIVGITGFIILTPVSIEEASIRTLHTLAFMFDENSSQPERFLEVFLAIFGVFIIWWALWSIADMILDGSLAKYIRLNGNEKRMKQMKGHVIIVGGGRVGEEIALTLKAKNKDFIIIENDAKVVQKLKTKKYDVLEGDGLQDDTLKNARIEKASKIVFTLPKTESNIIMTISAKELNPKIEVHSRCEKHNLVSKLKKVGAKVVIVPELEAAKQLALGLENEN